MNGDIMRFENDKTLSEDEKYIKINKEEFIKNCLTEKVFNDENYDYYHKGTMHDIVEVYSNDIAKEIIIKLYNLKNNIFQEIDSNENLKWDFQKQKK